MQKETAKKRPFRRSQAPKVNKSIVLVGLMGAGKTTVGRRLAKKLGLEFVDSDHEIERAADMSVSDIFSNFGEEEFRAGERRVIARLMTGKPKVVATGGGAFINEETRALIKEKALSVWLDADIDILVERTGRRDTRPLLRDGDPKEILMRLAEERAPKYAEADIKVQSCLGPHEDVVRDIVRAVNKKLSRRHNRRRFHTRFKKNTDQTGT
ncbi:shikimate kinase [Kordiimonas sediminis]|uniref:Shikimate kinase n=1 Tax=Kordiimonas sediminis TaxID=1735581 RepID=A0A919AHY7_9PROT|nr:shikimate kinase [Kordiimonas sediminis]GHF10664.1 shikimate kinase [Kordiimonas sediminis]